MSGSAKTGTAAGVNGAISQREEKDELIILKGAVESAGEAFVTIDENHKIVFYNRAAEITFGYPSEEVMGQDLNKILGPTCPENHDQAVQRYIKAREPKLIGHASELTASRKNGETFPALISFSVAHVQDRLFFTAIVRDLTERKAIEEKVRRAEQLAALGQVVAEVTHEIKNPLMMIGGFARQLIKQADREEDLKKLNIITKEVSRLEALLKELNDLYLHRALSLEEVDINELLRETCALTEQSYKNKGLTVVKDLMPAPALVKGDRGRLQQVFLNLVKNSIEAMEEKGTLLIRSLLSEDKIEVTIADTGPGIPEEDIDKVLTPFFTTKSQGTGLGLPVSKKIVEEHQGGSFFLTSRKGRGTEVKITMPVFASEKDKAS
ncbi:MAG: PAS domain S-box protein [Deltaproteobacteria bacterium]|nr:PAS domain S-box protein [Deltaproteobacteria bacterium]